MNIKEIAELTGKTERSIRLWSTKASENISSISEKISYSSRTKKPSDFTLEETVEIIRSGGNETLANLLKENANRYTYDGRFSNLNLLIKTDKKITDNIILRSKRAIVFFY